MLTSSNFSLQSIKFKFKCKSKFKFSQNIDNQNYKNDILILTHLNEQSLTVLESQVKQGNKGG